ncbi:MAG: type II toxin-antitoxin system YafQ family toxin [Clostridiales bacterium]|nr:type II toxin-antitoxin system YafQ family toxin [Clostridiales bacterium]
MKAAQRTSLQCWTRRECNISPDWLLIYWIDEDEIYVMLEAANAVKKSIRVRKLKRVD